MTQGNNELSNGGSNFRVTVKCECGKEVVLSEVVNIITDLKERLDQHERWNELLNKKLAHLSQSAQLCITTLTTVTAMEDKRT